MWPQLEPLLGKVAKPARYIGCEDGAQRPDHAPDGGLAAGLPRHLRDRPAQPGPADPLRDPERARRRASPSAPTPPGSTSRPRCAPRGLPLFSVDTHRPAADFDLLAFNLSAELTYTNLLNCSTSPACRCGPPTAAPSTRSSSPVATAPTTPSRSPTSSTSSCWATARRSSARSPRSSAAWKASAAQRAAAASTCCASWPASRASTCRRCTTCTYDGGRLVAVTPRYPDVPERVEKRTVADLAEWPVPEAASSCRSPRSCTTGSTSRSSGAAPGAAGSARRA